MKKIKIDLKKLLKEERYSIGNQEGQTPLFNIAELISSGTSAIDKEEIEDQIKGLIFDEFSLDDINNLISFIHYSKLETDDLLRFFKNYLNKLFILDTKEDATKRGVIIRFIIENNSKLFSLNELRNETILYKHAQWIWSDCISYYDFNLVIDTVIDLIQNDENALNNLLIRIPGYIKRFGINELKEATFRWYPYIISSDDRQKMNKWAKQLGIMLGISLHVNSRINEIPLEQECILNA